VALWLGLASDSCLVGMYLISASDDNEAIEKIQGEGWGMKQLFR